MRIAHQDFAALTTLRAIGALCVVQHHAWIFVAPAWPESWIVWGFQEWPDYFFILSGFILTHVYGKTLLDANRTQVGNYLIHRIARVYPLHLFMLLALIAIQAALWLWAQWPQSPLAGEHYFIGTNSIKAIPTNLLMIQAWGLHHQNTWNIPAWSVSAEFACYLLFPLMIRYRWAEVPTRAWLLTAVSIAGLAWIQLTQPDFHVTYDFSVLRAFCSFSLGCVLYYHRERLLACVAWLPMGLLQAATVAAIIWAWAVNVPGVWYVPLWFLLVLVLTDERTRFARALAWKPWVWLGDRSYSLYMVHALVLIPLGLWRKLSPDSFDVFLSLPRVLILALILLAVIGLSVFTYEAVENKGRRWVRQRFTLRA